MGFVRLGDIGDFQSGGTPSKSHTEYFGGNIPWITTVALNGDFIDERSAVDFLTDEGVKNSATKIVPPYALMVGTRVGVGKVAINKIPMCTNQDIISITNIDFDRWKLDYLRYVLRSASPKLNAQARGATIKGIKIDVLQQVAVPDILREKQDQIVNRLDAIQRCIQTRKEQLSQLDTLIKARFVELFGIYPNNEKGWKTGTISDIVNDVRYGSSRPAVDGGKYPYLRMNNITYGGELDLSDVKQIDVPEEELPKCTVQRGDVLFNRTNSKELVGKTCVYNRDELMVLAGFVIRVRVNDLVLPEFLSAFLNTDFSKQMLLGKCKTAIGQANINAQEMQDIGLYLPPIELQQQFVNFKAQVDKSKFLRYKLAV